MADFSPTSAATEGFHVIKNNPMALVIWIIVYLAATALAIGLIAATVGFTAFSHLPALMQAAQTDTPPDREVLIGMLTAFGSIIAIVGTIRIVVDTILVTAIKRAVLRPEERSPGYMRLGMDELRTFLVRLVRILVIVGIEVVIVIGAILLAMLHPLLAVGWCLLGAAALFYVLVKLSLAVSQSFAERRFNLFGSWTLTKGHFWPLLGTYLLAFVFVIAVSIVLSIVGGLAGGNAFMTEMMKNPETFDFDVMAPVLGTSIMINLVVGLIGETFNLPILGAPPAAIYRDLTTADPI